jgi:hypothetical protein
LRSAFGHVLKLKRCARERQATKLKTMKRSFDGVKPGEKTTPISSDVGEVVRTDVSDESLCGAVAQLGERCVRNAEVGGSNPLGSTITWRTTAQAPPRLAWHDRQTEPWGTRAHRRVRRVGVSFHPSLSPLRRDHCVKHWFSARLERLPTAHWNRRIAYAGPKVKRFGLCV